MPFKAELSFVPRGGLLRTLHFTPSKCRIIGFRSLLQSNEKPTAHTLLLLTAATAFRMLPVFAPWQRGVEPGFGLETTFQRAPSQCSVRVRAPFSWFSF